jgi:uncharacterized membrane protein YdjX (TVP38/TMEM64 family)
MSPLEFFAARLESFAGGAPLFFILVYIVCAVALVPASILTLVGGAVFGLTRGVPIAFTAAVLGSSAAFGVARWMARERVTRWLSRNERALAIADAVERSGATLVFLLRLSPVIPFNLLNYALGASGVRYRDFLIGSLGMLPGTILYTYYGVVAGDAAALVAGKAPPRDASYYAMLAVGLIATAGAVALVTRAAASRLAQRRDQ